MPDERKRCCCNCGHNIKAALENLEKNGFISTAKMKARTIKVLKVR